MFPPRFSMFNSIRLVLLVHLSKISNTDTSMDSRGHTSRNTLLAAGQNLRFNSAPNLSHIASSPLPQERRIFLKADIFAFAEKYVPSSFSEMLSFL